MKGRNNIGGRRFTDDREGIVVLARLDERLANAVEELTRLSQQFGQSLHENGKEHEALQQKYLNLENMVNAQAINAKWQRYLMLGLLAIIAGEPWIPRILAMIKGFL